MNRTAGFTLLEVLIAMVLLTGVFGLVFGGLRLGAQTTDAAGQVMAESQEFRTVHGLTRRFLARAMPAVWDEDDQPFAFEGNADSVRFVARLPAYPGIPGLYWVSLETESGRDGDALRLTLVPFRADRDDLDAMDPIEDTVLVAPPADIAFAYFGAEDGDGSPVWQDDWRSDDAMPALVKLTITAGAEKRTPWPALVVALGITNDTGCLFQDTDSLSKCRYAE